jgi:hypothetical protein
MVEVEAEAQNSEEAIGRATKRRKKHRLPEEAISFYHSYCELMQKTKALNKKRGFFRLAEFVPELYGQIHKDTHKRWKITLAEEPDPTRNIGLPPTLSGAALLRLAEVGKKVMEQISASTFVMTGKFRAELDKLACPRPKLGVGSWARQFLLTVQSTGSNKGNTKGVARKNKDDVERAIRVQKLNITFMRKKSNIPRERVWTMDETPLQLLPTNKCVWGKKYSGSDHAQVTAVLMHGTTPEDWLAQVIFEGETPQELPSQGLSPKLQFIQTENHRVNEDSIMKAFALMDKQLNPNSEGDPWLLIWDSCPSHISKAVRAASLEKFPHVILAYVKPRLAVDYQPTDVALTSPLKASIRRELSEELCQILFDNIDEENTLAEVVWQNVLKNKTTLWIETLMKKVMIRPNLLDRGLHRLRVPEDEKVQMEKAAKGLHQAGRLFEIAGRNHIVPEDAPDPDEEELPVEILRQPEEAWDVFGIEEQAEDQEIEDDWEAPQQPAEADVMTRFAILRRMYGQSPLAGWEAPQQPAEADVMTRFAILRRMYGQSPLAG